MSDFVRPYSLLIEHDNKMVINHLFCLFVVFVGASAQTYNIFPASTQGVSNCIPFGTYVSFDLQLDSYLQNDVWVHRIHVSKHPCFQPQAWRYHLI
jgi:hypothetical protein